MFKFIKQYAETISNVNIYPMISLLIFLVFFVVLLLLVTKMKKERVEELSNLPFDTEDLASSSFAKMNAGSWDTGHGGSLTSVTGINPGKKKKKN